ncbi:hypothetical protein F5Y04DRAFT_261513 [Hypomontagnella monticulosa]|nr:hypothetical protein F5Y04DRAFT_261513 [Hypomontagnella monticulosa]
MPKFWRDCQIVYPLEITEGMRPFITHPSTHLPVAVIPRARDDDLHCEFCKPLPQLADIRHLCSFHLVYILGPRYSEEFALAGGIINVPGGGIRFSRPGAVGNTIRTMRDLVFGSTAEPRDDEEVLENQRRATRGDFGHVGQGRPAPSHAANSPTT